MPMHTCPQCGTEFFHRKGARRFCDGDCYHAYERAHPNSGTHKPGSIPVNKRPVGTVRIRQRPGRNDGPRAWIKVAEPNVWRPRAVVVWEAAHGPVDPGFVVHHEDRDTLNDDPANLTLESRAAHLLEHRPEFEAKRAAAAAAARWPHHFAS